MKTIELFCASPASTAICSSMDQYSMVRHGTKHLDRLGDRIKTRTPPCLSELPFNPRPSFHQKSRKSSSRHNEIRRKSSADISDLRHNNSPPSTSSRYLLSDEKSMFQSSSVDAEISSSSVMYKKKSSVNNEKMKVVNNCKELEMFRSSSARSSKESPIYNNKLASTTTLARLSHESSVKNSTTFARLSHESPVFKLSSATSDMQLSKSSSTSTRNHHQVVELRVSIHCKGCEGKVRKHLSKMEGVTSFSIDLVSKKVTVVGNVTPLSVLASISKVKNAQFWPSPTTSSSSSSSTSSSSSSSMSRRA